MLFGAVINCQLMYIVCCVIIHLSVYSGYFTFSFDPIIDYSGSDNVVAVTQLREEVEALKKLLAFKDQQILDREKKVASLFKSVYVCVCLHINYVSVYLPSD